MQIDTCKLQVRLGRKQMVQLQGGVQLHTPVLFYDFYILPVKLQTESTFQNWINKHKFS